MEFIYRKVTNPYNLRHNFAHSFTHISETQSALDRSAHLKVEISTTSQCHPITQRNIRIVMLAPMKQF